MSTKPPQGNGDEWPRDDSAGSARAENPRADNAWNQSGDSGWGRQTDTGWGQAANTGSADAGRTDTGWGQSADTGWGRGGGEPNTPSMPYIAEQNPARPPRSQSAATGTPGAPPANAATPPSNAATPPANAATPPPNAAAWPGTPPGAEFLQPPPSPPGPNPPPPGNTPAGASPGGAAPTAQRPRRSKGLIAAVVVLAVIAAAAIGFGAMMFLNRDGDDGSTVAATTAPAGEDASTAPSAGPSEDAAPSDDPESSPTLPADPKQALDQIVTTDRKTVIADLDGKWVPQLSSKKVGLEAEGKTWEPKDILAEHEQMRKEYPRVQLVWSGDFASFKEDDFWVTIVGIGYDDPEDALSWCSSNGLGPDNCYAKQLNTSGGYEGTTRLQD